MGAQALAHQAPPLLLDDIEEVLITEQQIRDRIAELGTQISADYAGKDPLLIGVLRGVFIFMADLVRAIAIPIEVDAPSADGSESTSQGPASTT